ncbi:Tn3 family transposase [Nonomuraea sediminis]|uniref:Tn3 family transposase n=1 Tax=Nonomuraea sediminis TaxID=2835864 RepID=UPI001BDD5414|nr:Tn3 family transposase [Nonomuraea sediminis]
MTTLITGARGKVGQAVINRHHSAGLSVRAASAKPDELTVPAGVEAWCLTVLTNAVITWVEYYQLAVKNLRAGGRDVPDELLAYISPAHSENVNFFGVITVDVEAELAELDGGGWRPLRPAAVEPNLRP